MREMKRGKEIEGGTRAAIVVVAKKGEKLSLSLSLFFCSLFSLMKRLPGSLLAETVRAPRGAAC